jgi:hypothetical protein
MCIEARLVKHRFLDFLAPLILAKKRLPLSTSIDWFCGRFGHRMIFSPRKSDGLIILICLSLTCPLVSLSQEIEEGEFSRAMLAHKLQLLKSQFEQTQRNLLIQSVAGSRAEQLERLHHKIEYLEAEFRCGRYFPDLLDEQIVIIREQLILADPPGTTSMSEPCFPGNVPNRLESQTGATLLARSRAPLPRSPKQDNRSSCAEVTVR